MSQMANFSLYTMMYTSKLYALDLCDVFLHVSFAYLDNLVKNDLHDITKDILQWNLEAKAYLHHNKCQAKNCWTVNTFPQAPFSQSIPRRQHSHQCMFPLSCQNSKVLIVLLLPPSIPISSTMSLLCALKSTEILLVFYSFSLAPFLMQRVK